MGNPLKALRLLLRREVPAYLKLLYGVAVSIYIAWPLDLIVDVPGIGWIDDITFFAVASSLFASAAQKAVDHWMTLEPEVQWVRRRVNSLSSALFWVFITLGVVLHLGVLEIPAIAFGGAVASGRIATFYYEDRKYLLPKNKRKPDLLQDEEDEI